MTNELLTTAEMARADAFAVAHGVPSLTLMENAGRAVADAIAARFKPCAVTVLCGPGNNGGDGFVVARLLDESGFTVRVAQDAKPKGDAAAMSDRWKGTRVALEPEALDGAKLVVDALFGAGLSRPLEGAAAQLVEGLNDLPVVAVDIPSGVSGDTGQPLGGCVCQSRAHRHLLPQKARTSFAAGPRAVRRNRGGAISAFRRKRPTPSCMKIRPRSGSFPGPSWTVTNIPAAIAWW